MSQISVTDLKGPLGELMDQLSGPNGTQRFNEFKLWLKGVTVRFLAFVCEVAVPGAREFRTAEKFNKANPKVKFRDFGLNFIKQFGQKIERNVQAAKIAVRHLEQAGRDPEIMAELGPEKRAISLTHFYALIEAQGQGQAGPLLINGCANIAHIRGDDSNFWAVRAHWDDGDGWYVYADSVEVPVGWPAGGQVLSQV